MPVIGESALDPLRSAAGTYSPPLPVMSCGRRMKLISDCVGDAVSGSTDVPVSGVTSALANTSPTAGSCVGAVTRIDTPVCRTFGSGRADTVSVSTLSSTVAIIPPRGDCSLSAMSAIAWDTSLAGRLRSCASCSGVSVSAAECPGAVSSLAGAVGVPCSSAVSSANESLRRDCGGNGQWSNHSRRARDPVRIRIPRGRVNVVGDLL